MNKSIKRKNNKKRGGSPLMLEASKLAVPLSLLLVREFVKNDTFKDFGDFLKSLTKPIRKSIKKIISK